MAGGGGMFLTLSARTWVFILAYRCEWSIRHLYSFFTYPLSLFGQFFFVGGVLSRFICSIYSHTIFYIVYLLTNSSFVFMCFFLSAIRAVLFYRQGYVSHFSFFSANCIPLVYLVNLQCFLVATHYSVAVVLLHLKTAQTFNSDTF